jgi:hypothetical protein
MWTGDKYSKPSAQFSPSVKVWEPRYTLFLAKGISNGAMQTDPLRLHRQKHVGFVTAWKKDALQRLDVK